MKPDLHTHTTSSDGLLTPAELVALADKHRVTLLAVTDHDTFDGAAQLLGKPTPMPILQGVELSLRDMPGLHLLHRQPGRQLQQGAAGAVAHGDTVADLDEVGQMGGDMQRGAAAAAGKVRQQADICLFGDPRRGGFQIVQKDLGYGVIRQGDGGAVLQHILPQQPEGSAAAAVHARQRTQRSGGSGRRAAQAQPQRTGGGGRADQQRRDFSAHSGLLSPAVSG